MSFTRAESSVKHQAINQLFDDLVNSKPFHTHTHTKCILYPWLGTQSEGKCVAYSTQ